MGHAVVSVFLLALTALSCSISSRKFDPTGAPVDFTITASKTPTTPPALTPTRTATPFPPTRAPTATELIFVEKAFDEQHAIPRAVIQMALPHLVSGGVGAGLFNQTVDDIIQRERKQLLDQAAENEAWRSVNLPAVASELNVSHFVWYNHDGLASVMFVISTYMAGAAHPNVYTQVINLQAAGSPRLLSLDDLFIPQSGYLERLSDYCAGELNSRDALMFRGGVAPVMENFRNWLLDPRGVVILFDPDQVAPFALGIQEVLVPYPALQRYIDPNGALGGMIE